VNWVDGMKTHWIHATAIFSDTDMGSVRERHAKHQLLPRTHGAILRRETGRMIMRVILPLPTTPLSLADGPMAPVMLLGTLITAVRTIT